MSATPGPWIIEKRTGEKGSDCGLDVIQKESRDRRAYRGTVCHVTDAENIRGITKAERDANARLIAAAPAMLAALYEALEFAEDQEDVVDGPDGEPRANAAMLLATEIRSAISKATGSAA